MLTSYSGLDLTHRNHKTSRDTVPLRGQQRDMVLMTIPFHLGRWLRIEILLVLDDNVLS
jgi:hypothetical protein